MTALAPPVLQLRRDHTNRPFGGGWWPSGVGVSRELLDLVARWPDDRPKILGSSYISDDWDQAESDIPPGHRTRTLVLNLSDRSTCRLLTLPATTLPEVAAEFLKQASDPSSTWRKMDFMSTFRHSRRSVPTSERSDS